MQWPVSEKEYGKGIYNARPLIWALTERNQTSVRSSVSSYNAEQKIQALRAKKRSGEYTEALAREFASTPTTFLVADGNRP
jgi:hypothetical protein